MSPKRKKQVQAPEIIQRLSKPPGETWSQGAFYHGSRAALLVLVALAITFLFPAETDESTVPFEVGEVATDDVPALVDFEAPRDPAVVAAEKEQAAAAVPPVFTFDGSTQDSVEASIGGFFDEIQRAVDAGGQAAVERVLGNGDLGSLVADAGTFLDPIELQALRQGTLSAIRQHSSSTLDADDGEEVRASGRIRVVRTDGSEIHLDTEDLLWGTEFLNAAVDGLESSTPAFQRIVRILLIHFFDSPYTFDVARTTVSRSEAESAVPATERTVVEGALIVRRGDQIDETLHRRLTAHEEALQAAGMGADVDWNWVPTLGRFLLNLVLLSIFGVLLYFYRREIYGNYRWLLLLTSLFLVYFLASAGITSWQEYRWELLPIAFVVLPVAILWDGRVALILALVLGVLTGAQEPYADFRILAFVVVGGAAAALSARAVRRRSQTWIFIALITGASALCLAAFALMGVGDPAGVLSSIPYAALNATVSAILAMGFMPVFEWFTGITTDQTLLEWADPNRSLLKTLSLEASGTYAHTINVANLAEAAATAIGANGLLTRVGVYYHDVGKMLKPQYFVENQPGGRNPHDKLKPHTSAAIVREHVIEGEKMARDEGVPDVVARFIPEHHGTQLIGFFYEKAREESEEPPNEAEFRYPGPKPQSRETAITMLADSIESATRVLQDATPERIEELVATIVKGKIQDGQLSESPLTLREIQLIQNQFVKVVSGMFHHRLDYPATRHLTESTREEEPAAPETLAEPDEGGHEPNAGSDEAGTDSPSSGPGPSATAAGRVPERGDEEGPQAEQLPLAPPADAPKRGGPSPDEVDGA